MPRVSVIVLNFNGAAVIEPCLEALARQTYRDFETIVVDNASIDGSLMRAQSIAPGARFMPLSENLGFCRANNLAIEATDSEFVALLNNDTEVDADWLQSLVDALDRDGSTGFCASRMIRIDDRETIDSAGDIFYLHGVAAKRGEGKPASEFVTPEYVFGACAGAALYRRKLFDAVGALDTSFGSMDEDVDLSFRAQLAGYRCRYVPTAVVFHHVGASFNRVPESRVRLARRNILTILVKNMPRELLFRYGLLMAAYLIAGDLRWCAKGYWRAVLSARVDNLRSLRRVLKQRRQIQAVRKIGVADLERLFTKSSLLGVATGHRLQTA
jgi:GT2 family glycosyltransferase